MKKNGFTMVELMAIMVIMASMLLIILPAINNTIKSSEEKKKKESLNNIYMAAENYLMANYDDYKIDNVGDTIYVYITDLINNNYMSINTLNPNNDSIFSNKDVVKITRNEDGTFNYELDYLKTLIETLLEQYKPSNTTGLVKDSTNPNLYYYKGTHEQVTNNFLWYGGHQWRVLEFDNENKTLTLITQQPLTGIQPANSVWTNESSYNSSYINKWLNDYFLNTLDNNIKNNILDTTFNIGIYTDVDEITTTKKVGLLDKDKFNKAGGYDSFLYNNNYFWSSNRYDSTTHATFGNVTNVLVSNSNGVRPVIKISDLNIDSGIGTLTNSYLATNKIKNINDIQVGEYVQVPYIGTDNACGSDKRCTFRVVSKNNDSVKIVLNGLLPNTSIWADNASDNIKITDKIYVSVLKPFINNINNKYITTGTFNVGMYAINTNYETVQNSTITSNVGLPTVGEMFSGNDIEMSFPTNKGKIFVDVSTIENPTASECYWTMNRFNSSDIRHVHYFGNLNETKPTNVYGVRPVIYLKNNLNFIGGNGTAQSPYIIQ